MPSGSGHLYAQGLNMSYTPGPWTIEEYGDEDCPALVIHKDTESRVCFMATPGSMGDPGKIEADARLICAAPDMLAALKNLCEADRDDLNDSASAVWQKATDAIRKATVSPTYTK